MYMANGLQELIQMQRFQGKIKTKTGNEGITTRFVKKNAYEETQTYTTRYTHMRSTDEIIVCRARVSATVWFLLAYY